jgi:hypothetical protein
MGNRELAGGERGRFFAWSYIGFGKVPRTPRLYVHCFQRTMEICNEKDDLQDIGDGGLFLERGARFGARIPCHAIRR